MDTLNLLQWPAMLVTLVTLVTLVASWLVASPRKGLRNGAFWVFLASNALWVAWGMHTGAWALVLLQLGLAVMNIRGAVKTESKGAAPP